MATTTNYGWTTPDDTALVKDGASAIRTLGSSVDTTTKNLNPETTLGDLSFRSSTSNVNTRIPIGSSGQHLTVVAGVPAWATASDQTPLTTKGDLFTFSTLDTRLGVGANNTILTADSAEATGLKWATPAAAGGKTLLQTVTLSGNSTTSSSISGSYKDLFLVGKDITSDSNDSYFMFRFNSDTGSNYNNFGIEANDSTMYPANNLNSDRYEMGATKTTNTVTGATFFSCDIFRYAETEYKVSRSNITSGTTDKRFCMNRWNNTAAITTITFRLSTHNFATGTIYIYGVS